MGKKSSPQAPTPPDPTKLAAAQTQSNLSTANAEATLNRSNQVTPWGSSTWTPGQPGPDGTPQWTQNITLSPEQQRLLDNDNRISEEMSRLGINQIGRVQDSLANPVDYSGLTKAGPIASSISLNGITPLQKSVAGEQAQTSIDTTGTENLTRGVSNEGIRATLSSPEELQARARQMGVSPDQLVQAMKDAQGAAYNMQSQYLDADYGDRQKSLENQLIQQGVVQGSEAWDKAMQNFGRQRTFDYNNAFNNSFATGLAANNQLFNQNFMSNDQVFGQDLASGEFQNAAQSQRFNQDFANAELNNRAAAQLAQQRLAQGEFANAGELQNFGVGMANANLSNSANQQLFDAKERLANLNNRAAAQSADQRGRELQELLTQRNQPLNELNALRSGSQVTAPNFSATPQTGVAGTDTAGIANQGYQQQMGVYNAQMAQRNAILQGLFGLGGAAILA